MAQLQQPTEDTLLGLAGASRLANDEGLKLSPQGLKHAADRGEIPCLRTADRGNRLFRPSDVIALAKRRLGR